MGAYALHLAMAALVGASVVAVSTYYLHLSTLNQLLEFAKTIKEAREREHTASEVGGESGDSAHHFRKSRSAKRMRNHRHRKGNGHYRRMPASLPDVMVISGATDASEKGEEE